MVETSLLLYEVLRSLLFPLTVAFATSWLALFIFEKYKTDKLYDTLRKNLDREMQLAKYIHPINRESARHLTGAFVLYPVETVKRLLFDPAVSEMIADPLFTALQNYLYEALRLNSLIENAKLLVGAGQHLGSLGMPGVTTEALRKAIDTEPAIENLIADVQKAIPK